MPQVIAAVDDLLGSERRTVTRENEQTLAVQTSASHAKSFVSATVIVFFSSSFVTAHSDIPSGGLD